MISDTWSIETFARVRPPRKQGKHFLEHHISDISGTNFKRLEISIPPDTDSSLIHSNEDGYVGFNFNEVFDVEASQEEVYEKVVENKVKDIFQGLNSTVFAYGQTGSGKTYSIFGGDTFQSRGLIPRALGNIFQLIKNKTSPSLMFKCHLSFTEVYKENLYDLLDSQKRHVPMEQWVPVQLLESENGLMLRNVNVFEVDTEEKALNIFFMGNTNRITSSTQMNNASSRSHAIFTIVVESTEIVPCDALHSVNHISSSPPRTPNSKVDEDSHMLTNSITTVGKLNLVDLAGSERMYKTQNTKSLISEAKSINLSLHYLEQVIISLRDRHSGTSSQHSVHIPYRNSILTNMLRDSLGGNCKSCFIITLSAERPYFEESVSSCRFGQRCGEVKVNVHANRDVHSNDEILKLQLQTKVLTKQMAEIEQIKEKLILENCNLKDEVLTMQNRLVAAEEELALNSVKSREVGVDMPIATKELSDEEHDIVCGNIQVLLTPVQQYLQISQGIGDDEEWEAGVDEVINEAQNSFYDSLVEQNGPVVMEIAVSLGNLVLELYKDREVHLRKGKRVMQSAIRHRDSTSFSPGEDTDKRSSIGSFRFESEHVVSETDSCGGGLDPMTYVDASKQGSLHDIAAEDCNSGSVSPNSRVSMREVAQNNGVSPLMLTPLYKLGDSPVHVTPSRLNMPPVNRQSMTPQHGGTPMHSKTTPVNKQSMTPQHGVPHYMTSKHEFTPKHTSLKLATPPRASKEPLSPYMMSDDYVDNSTNLSSKELEGYQPPNMLNRYSTEYRLGDQPEADELDEDENPSTKSEGAFPHPHTLLSTSIYSSNNLNPNELNDMQIRLLIAGSIFLKLGKMPLMVNSNKQLRYVCVTNDLKHLRWKHMLTSVSNNGPNERLSPVPSHRSMENINDGSSVLALNQIQSVEVEVVDKFLLWTSSITSKESIANNKNYSYFIIIKGFPANSSELKSLKLEFVSASYPWDNESKYRMTMLWVDALKIAVKQAKSMDSRNRISHRQGRDLGSDFVQESAL